MPKIAPQTPNLSLPPARPSAPKAPALAAFLANSPKTTHLGLTREPAYSVDDLRMMFKDKQFPPGWEGWKKTSSDWAVSTTALALSAEKELIAAKLR